MKQEDNFDEIVSSALEKQTDYELSPGFADRIISMIQQKEVQKESRRDKWWLLGGIVAIIGTLVYVFANVKMNTNTLLPGKFHPGVGVYTFFSGYSGLVIFGLVFIIALHIIDKRVLRHR